MGFFVLLLLIIGVIVIISSSSGSHSSGVITEDMYEITMMTMRIMKSERPEETGNISLMI